MSSAFSTIFVLLPSLFLVCSSEPVEDKSALLDFARRLHRGRQLNWTGNTSACSDWVGVTCSKDRRRVVGVRLPGVGLNGAVPPNTLGRLSALQTLSLRRNNLTGPFPGELTRIPTLTKLHLQCNNFSGHLPSNLSLFTNLTVLDLSSNRFNGSLPPSLSNLTLLVSLNLSHNSFSGQVPDFNLPNLQQLDLADNQLAGMLPRSLQKYPRSSFSGNNNLSVITPPLSLPPFIPPFPSPASKPMTKKTKLGESAMIGILIGSCVLVFIMLSVLLIVFYSKKRDRFNGVAGKMGSESPEKVVGKRDDGNRIVFFEGCRYAFDLEDLLRSSAEVLGKGTFGTAYKAILEDGTPVAVKRLKEVSAGRREFEQQMEVVGMIRHENVVQLRGYYYSKDEKLMIYDYYSRGSVYTLLHGKRGEDRIPLDWDTRLKIAIGMARGVARIHAENSGKLVHGNIKSSNIFLNAELYGCVSDLGLSPFVNIPAPFARLTGYRAPEVVDTRKASQAADIYGVGVVLLELLTGKSPVQATAGDEIVHLVRWVQSVVKEEWTGEVFDLELMRYPNIEVELVEMLQIALACVLRIPDQRPKIAELVKMIEDVRCVDTGNRSLNEVKTEENDGRAAAAGTSGSQLILD